MDIFKWAEETGWKADYYDIYTGYIYGVSRTDNKNRIPVYDDNNLIGFVNKEKQ